MNKKLIILLVICILEAITIGFLLKERKIPVTPTDVPITEIVRDSIIRDSIFIENEKIEKEIVYIREQYKEDSTNIMSATDSMLLDSFSRYIEDYNAYRFY